MISSIIGSFLVVVNFLSCSCDIPQLFNRFLILPLANSKLSALIARLSPLPADVP